MRSTSWILAAVIVAGSLGSAFAGQPGCTGCNGNLAGGPTGQWSLGCDACRTPPGYCLTPGCCEYQRHCCDNAWAGYCQHRTKVDAFWARVGAPKRRCAESVGYPTPSASCQDRSVERGWVAPVARPKAVGPAPTLEPKPAIKSLPPVSAAPVMPEVPPPPAPGDVPAEPRAP